MGKQFVANSLTSAIATEHVCIFAVSWLRSIFFVPKCLRFFFKLLLNQSDELGLYSETQLVNQYRSEIFAVCEVG